MKLDPIDGGGPRRSAPVRGALAQSLAVGLARSPDVSLRARRDRDRFDGVDLDQTEADPAPAAWLDRWPLPQADRQRDIAGQDVVTQLAAELHTRTLTADAPAQHPLSLPLAGARGSSLNHWSEGLAVQPAQAGFGRPARTVFAAQEAVVVRLVQ